MIYSLRKIGVSFDIKKPNLVRMYKSHSTATTKKGSVAATFGINGRQIVIASTHGTEGVRGKKRGSECPGSQQDNDESLKKEDQRVKDFENGLAIIQTLCNGTTIDSKESAVLWGGDFNPRGVETEGEKTGCAIFPEGTDVEADLASLLASRDILGSRQTDPQRLVTFKDVLDSTNLHLQEAEGLRCPTYKKTFQKEENTMPKEGEQQFKQFKCLENGSWMYYKVSHTPSWPDRIFHSYSRPWLECGDAHRVTHHSDHDAVLLTCVVKADETDSCPSHIQDELDELGARCCCKSTEDCKLLSQASLATSKQPWKLLAKVCPAPYHNYKRFFDDKFPVACADDLNAYVTGISFGVSGSS